MVPQLEAKSKGKTEVRRQRSEIRGQKAVGSSGIADCGIRIAESRAAPLHCCGLFEFQMSRTIFQSRPSRRHTTTYLPSSVVVPPPVAGAVLTYLPVSIAWFPETFTSMAVSEINLAPAPITPP